MQVVFVGRQRAPWKVDLWYLLTLGIYRRVWLYKINKEVDGHAAMGYNHRLTVALLLLPFIGPSIVTFQTARRLNNDLHSGADIKYGPGAGLWAITLIPILGNLFFLPWTQQALNQYWQHERSNRQHGIDLDQGLTKDKKFLVELKKAKAISGTAGSRFDRRKNARRAWVQNKRASFEGVGDARRSVRQAGGSTPVLPWLRPKVPPVQDLGVTCGHCDTGFHVARDPFAETILLCPKCGRHEVLPSARGEPLMESEGAVVATLKVNCPQCKAKFHARRKLQGPTPIQCYKCGHEGSIPALKPVKRPARPKATAKTTT